MKGMWIRRHQEHYWKVSVIAGERHIGRLDRLIADIKSKHGVELSRSTILRAIIEVAEREGWAADLFKV
jgi:hypothetical protein